MVEYAIDLNSVFSSLADPTRRDILRRVSQSAQSVGELAEAHTKLSFAAVAKHISVLEEAQLVIKKREGRYQIISVNPKAFAQATKVLEQYKTLWETRFNTLDTLLHS
jgi:DNA-binding transcriptional ArsR family regulator